MNVSRGLGVWGAAVLAGLVLAGCGTRLNKAPVEDRGTSASSAQESMPGVDAKLLPGAENAGKPGYYTVKPGDTLPGKAPAVAIVAASPGVIAPSPAPPQTASAASSSDDQPGFIWPASGTLLAGFDEARNKGFDISGKAGDPVMAAADGRVVYAGAGLRGYGNLIILKHNNIFLTAYAHNQTLLVKEDQSVRRGQKIAEMGSTDTDRVKLHFEVRRQGKPVDPARYLPSR